VGSVERIAAAASSNDLGNVAVRTVAEQHGPVPHGNLLRRVLTAVGLLESLAAGFLQGIVVRNCSV
jgi:hypothetical protein